MKIILKLVRTSAQHEVSNSFQRFQYWYNTFTTIKVNWEDNMDELITLLADLVIEEINH